MKTNFSAGFGLPLYLISTSKVLPDRKSLTADFSAKDELPK
ncbi:hypothetical protein [Ruegeria atlantica]|nr:hypothetical protein [Ruegeria atlantica]